MFKRTFYIAIFTLGSIIFSGTLFAQLIAYNDGLTVVTVTTSTNIYIDGSYMSKTNGTDGIITNEGSIYITQDFYNYNTSSSAFSGAAGGAVYLNGSTASQNILGTTDPAFYNLYIQNTYTTTPQIVLGLNTSVTNILEMSSGTINLNSKTLTLGTSILNTGTLSRTGGWAYGGSFKRWVTTSGISSGSSAGLYPLGGSSDYRPFSLYTSSSPSVGGFVTVNHNYVGGRTVVNFADGAFNIDARSNSYWAVSTGGGLSGGTYGIYAGGTGFGLVQTESDLRLVQASSVIGTAGTNTGTYSSPEVNRTGISLFNLANNFYIGTTDVANSPLPIELLSFDAKLNSDVVDVEWETATEINCDYFIVEKTIDGDNFEFVSKVAGAGNSFSVQKYSTVDTNPYDGVSYYRLKQVDFDGSFTYSNLVAVEVLINSGFSVYPNPYMSGSLKIKFESELDKEELLVIVYSNTGAEMYSKVVVVKKENNYLAVLDLENRLAPGLYHIVGASKHTTKSQRLVIY
ncbi:MAG: hypothetical protein J0M08_11100 [Bacteroidetes bacterium]|nr:hypothetical protein [Bacteroidota bacterium]